MRPAGWHNVTKEYQHCFYQYSHHQQKKKKKSLNFNRDDGDAVKLVTITNVKAGFAIASEVASCAKVVLVFSNKLT